MERIKYHQELVDLERKVNWSLHEIVNDICQDYDIFSMIYVMYLNKYWNDFKSLTNKEIYLEKADNKIFV